MTDPTSGVRRDAFELTELPRAQALAYLALLGLPASLLDEGGSASSPPPPSAPRAGQGPHPRS